MLFSLSGSDRKLSFLLVVSASAWGLYWLPLRTIEEAGMPGSWSVVFMNAFPLIILVPLITLMRRNLFLHLFPMFWAGLMIGAAFTLYATSLVETSVVRATLLFYLSPIWGTIIGVIWLSERLTLVRIISIILAMLGLILLLSFSGNSTFLALNLGDLFGLLSGFFWAMGASFIKKWPSAPTLPLTGIVYIFSTVFSVFFALWIYEDSFPDGLTILRTSFTAASWSIIILLPSFWIIFKISKVLFPGRVGILMMSEVVVAIVSAKFLIPEESMSFYQWLGALAIICAGLLEILIGYVKDESSVRDA